MFDETTTFQITHAQVGADELFGIQVPESQRANTMFPVRTGALDGVPEIDMSYVFRPDQLALLRFFYRGDEKALMLTGETGPGKTSLVEQTAARTNWPVVAVGCHEKLELQELIGRITITEAGSTGWQDGPVIDAMRRGAILLLDEGNFLDPGAVGGLNRVLDTLRNVGGASYSIPETGETVKAHPDFRVAMTGNAIDGAGKSNYRGIKPMNLALLDRFTLGISVDYLPADQEVTMLHRRSPQVREDLIKLMVEVANGVRNSFANGDIRCTMSTRVLISVCAKLSTCPAEKQPMVLLPMLKSTMLFRVSVEDRTAIENVVNEMAQRDGVVLS
ncbi:AAA family ATPase [Ottowia thiooxydans]|uniref:AAA family ATPase n=1 Tax=Ottowia thiooxydans TaxID=219182 RepID=UPI0004238D77|nr:AAA family ATPase [Ottowia thiooxydans]